MIVYVLAPFAISKCVKIWTFPNIYPLRWTQKFDQFLSGILHLTKEYKFHNLRGESADCLLKHIVHDVLEKPIWQEKSELLVETTAIQPLEGWQKRDEQ